MNIVSAGLLLFWGIYFAMAGTGNVVDRLSNHGYREILQVLEHEPGVDGKGFQATRVWNILGSRLVHHNHVLGNTISIVLCVAAFILYLLGNRVLLQYAFFIGMGLFEGLIMGNEAFVYYDDVEEHVTMLIAQLIHMSPWHSCRGQGSDRTI